MTAILVAVAEVSVIARAGGGFYWLIPAVAASLIGGLVNAWPVDVEPLGQLVDLGTGLAASDEFGRWLSSKGGRWQALPARSIDASSPAVSLLAACIVSTLPLSVTLKAAVSRGLPGRSGGADLVLSSDRESRHGAAGADTVRLHIAGIGTQSSSLTGLDQIVRILCHLVAALAAG